MRKYTAGSMVYVEEAMGHVALVEPRRAPGYLTFPGGYSRRWPRESAEESGLREVKEELGLELSSDLEPVAVYQQDGRPHYDHLFASRLDKTKPKIRPRARFWTVVEVSHVDWYDLTNPELWPTLVPEARTALRVFDSHFKLGLHGV